MFFVVYVYRVRPGCESASIAIHEHEQSRRCQPHGWIARELLRNADDPQEFIAIARFENEDTAWVAIEEPEYRAWYARLVSFAEAGPTVTHYKSPSQNE